MKDIEEQVDRRMEELRSDPERLRRYGLGTDATIDQAQWAEIRRMVTLEVQTEWERRQREQSADAEPPEQVEKLRDRFELRSELGRGAQGRTYLGFDWQTERKVAVKELLLRDVEDWKAIELFEREGQALKFLDHPGIPDYVDAFHLEEDSGERFFLVQEFVDGTDFETLVDEGLTLTEKEAKEFLEDLLEILIYLQDRSPPVIHRDIKPSNIMRRRDGSLALIDFGAVQSVIPNEKGGSTIIGTSGYMPIEQLMGRAGPATDLYAVGATVIHLLSRRHPADLPMRDLRIEFEDAVNVSPRFRDYLKKLTEPRAEKRFQSASEALDALRAVDRPTPKPPTHRSPPQRRPASQGAARQQPEITRRSKATPVNPPSTKKPEPIVTDYFDSAGLNGWWNRLRKEAKSYEWEELLLIATPLLIVFGLIFYIGYMSCQQ